MSWAESIFLNWLPLFGFIYLMWWLLFKKKPKKQEPKPTQPVAHPPRPAFCNLAVFARDFSGNDPKIVAFAESIVKKHCLLPEYIEEFELFDNEDKPNDPNQFGSAIVHAITAQSLYPNDATIRKFVSYVDWKEDLPELIEGFERMLAPHNATGRVDPSIFDDEALLPHYKELKGPPIVAAHYGPVFAQAGLRLMVLNPGGGWDAYLFVALPEAIASRWNDTLYQATLASPRNSQVEVFDAAWLAVSYIESAKPKGIPIPVSTTAQRVVTYWQDT